MADGARGDYAFSPTNTKRRALLHDLLGHLDLGHAAEGQTPNRFIRATKAGPAHTPPAPPPFQPIVLQRWVSRALGSHNVISKSELSDRRAARRQPQRQQQGCQCSHPPAPPAPDPTRLTAATRAALAAVDGYDGG
eukprot:gene19333-10429_t